MLSLSLACQNKKSPKNDTLVHSQFLKKLTPKELTAQKRKSEALPEKNPKKQKLSFFQCHEKMDSCFRENNKPQKTRLNIDKLENKESELNNEGLDASALKTLDDIESPFFFLETFFDERTKKKFCVELLLSEVMTPNNYFALLSELEGYFQGPLSTKTRDMLKEIYTENYQNQRITRNIYTFLKDYNRHLQNHSVHLVSFQFLMKLNKIEYLEKYFEYHSLQSIHKVNQQNLLFQAVVDKKIAFIQLFLKYGADRNKIPEWGSLSPEELALLPEYQEVFPLFFSSQKA